MIVLTACHGRHDVFNYFLQSLPKNIYLVCVGSDDDNLRLFNESKLSGTYIIHENKPLGKKWNYGLQFAKSMLFDYLMIIGSDDFFSPDLWEWYKECKVHYTGLLDIYFMDSVTGKIKYNAGFIANRQGEPHGAGRMLHRSVLETLDWQLWDDNINEGLDASMTNRLNTLLLDYEFIKVQSKGFVALDMKTSENIHKISEYSGHWIDDDERNFVLNKLGWITR